MARIIDDFGYRTKIPEEEYIAITLVDNGIDPYKKMKKKSLHNKVIQEYKRRLVINIAAYAKKSSKNKNLQSLLHWKKYKMRSQFKDKISLTKEKIKHLAI